MAEPPIPRADDGVARPIVLCDSSVLRDDAIVPSAWVAGLDCRSYESGALLQTASPADLAAAEGLIVRSMTRVDNTVLAAMPALRAVATLSSGRDHLDLEAIQARGVTLTTGHGGNAHAVADWVLWALCRLWGVAPSSSAMTGRRVVVVGVGAVGSEVIALLEAQGATCVAVDPPRAEREPGFASTALRDALARPTDALTLHVPLERVGPHPTQGLVNADVLAAMPGGVVIQASRGGVVDEVAARMARETGLIAGLAFDVFVGEPTPDPALVAIADLATPHIAGHSAEGKVRVAGLALAPWLRQLRGESDAIDTSASCLEARAAVAPNCGLGVAAPFAALDAADVAMRSLAAAGASFRPLRARHQRCELDR